jgi:hypothetical protein
VPASTHYDAMDMSDGNNESHSSNRILTITVSTPALIVGVLAVLWFTGNLDGLLSRVGLPGLTHACGAKNSLGDVVRCALYVAENGTENQQSSSAPQQSNPVPTQNTVGTTGQPTTAPGGPAGGPQPSQACLQRTPTLPVASFQGWCGIKPKSIAVSADGGNIIGQIRWSSWTPEAASGVGISDIQSCIPSCVDGTDTPVTTSVRFVTPVDGVFETMIETRNGQRTSYSFVHGYWPYSASDS